jgi:hypothetical protein
VSAVASQPRIALRAVAIRVAVAPLTVLVAVSAVVRTLVAWNRATPAYFPDEYMYASFGRSIAHGTMPAIRGVPAHFLPLLEPLITAPGWLFPNVDQGYRAVQAIDATFMSLAAIPVYMLARRLGLTTRYSLVAAALSLTIPSLLLSSFVVSEPIAYPIVLGAVAAAVHALDRPGWRSYSLFLVVAALAALARMQFALLLPLFVITVLLVALREHRFKELIRLQRIPLAVLVAVAAGLFAVGPARNSGYYPSFLFIPNFHPSQAVHYLGADALVLAFGSGFVLVPGALLGLWLAVTRPRARAELAFGIVTVLLTLALLVQAVVYGNLGFVQERYLFYLLPLWTLAFLLYAQRGWPLKIAHAVVAAALVGAALAQPLSKYAVGGGQAHSAVLFALTWLEKPTGSLGAAAVLIAYTGAAALVLMIGLAFRWPRLVTPFAVAFALLVTTGASVAATRYDQSNAGRIKSFVLGDHPSWVDESGVGPTTLLALPGAKIPDAKLFWNKSLDRVLLLPGMKHPDPFTAGTADVGKDGLATVSGKPVIGPVMVDDTGTAMELQQATLIKRTVAGSLYRPHDALRFRLIAFAVYADGWLGSRGAILVWPTAGEHKLAGRLELPVRAPGAAANAKIRFTQSQSTKKFSFTAKPGKLRTFSVPLCASGPVTLIFDASPIGVTGDGREVAAKVGRLHFVPDASACAKTPRKSNG